MSIIAFLVSKARILVKEQAYDTWSNLNRRVIGVVVVLFRSLRVPLPLVLPKVNLN